MTNFDGFTQPLGSISVGSGTQVLPAPIIPSDMNPHLRSLNDRVFVWESSAAEPVQDVASGGTPIPVPGVESASYVLEITPDLRWANYEAMFQPAFPAQLGVGNGLLRRFSNLIVGSELVATNAAGGSLSTQLAYTINIAELSEMIGDGYPDFLWRVRGVRADGIEGTPSVIQRFRSRVQVNTSDVEGGSDWTIDPISLPVKSTFVTISGTKNPSISYIEVDGNTGASTNLTPTRWIADIMVPPSGTKVLLRAIDTQGNISTYRSINLTIETADLTVQPVTNAFDEFGYALDLDRLPSESNEGFRSRLLDVYKHPGSPHYNGLINTICREIDLEQIDQALILTPGINPSNNKRFSDVHFTLGPRYARIDSPLLQVHHEHHKVGGWSWSIELDNRAMDSDMTVESPIGVEIDDLKWDVDIENNKVIFIDDTYANKDVWVSYQYEERFDTVEATIAGLNSWISSVTVSGAPLIDVTIDSTVETNNSCDELGRAPRALISRQRHKDSSGSFVSGVPIRWCEAILWVVEDHETKRRFLNSDNNYFGTAVEGWATRVRQLAANQWGHAIADRSIWMSASEIESLDAFLDTTYDPTVGFWGSSNPAKARRYSTEEAHAFNYISPGDGSDMVRQGMNRSSLKSGIGDSTDLLVRISEDEEVFSFIQDQASAGTGLESNVAHQSTMVVQSDSGSVPLSGSGTPAAPEAFTVVQSGINMNLSWSAVTNVPIAFYEIRRGLVWSGAVSIGQISATSLSTTNWAPTDLFAGVTDKFFIRAVSTAGVYGNVNEATPSSSSAWYNTGTYTAYTRNEHEVGTSLSWDAGTLSNLQNYVDDDSLLVLTDTAQNGIFESSALDTITVGNKTIGHSFQGFQSIDLTWLTTSLDWINTGNELVWFGPIDPALWSTHFTVEYAASVDNITYSNWQELATTLVAGNRYFKVRVMTSAPIISTYLPYLIKLSWAVQDSP